MAHVLLVEDEPLIRMMAEEDLAELGHSVTAAADGDAAFALISKGLVFDILVTDIRMRGMIDGWELARRARAALPAVGIVYISGYAGDTHQPIGNSRFVKKPYRIDQLAEAVRGQLPNAGSADLI